MSYEHERYKGPRCIYCEVPVPSGEKVCNHCKREGPTYAPDPYEDYR